MAGQEEVERAPQGVDIRAVVEVGTFHGLFGGQVVDRPQHPLVLAVGLLHVGACQAGQPHVDDLHHPLPVDQQVGRFDVAMDHVLLVPVRQAVGRLPDMVRGGLEVQRPLRIDHLLKVLPVDVLHDDEIAAAFGVDAVRPDDVGMVEGGDGSGLGEEPFQGVGVLADLPGKDFQRHSAVHLDVFAEEHASHAAAPQQFDQLVLTQKEGTSSRQQLAGLPPGEQFFPGQDLGNGCGVVVFAGGASAGGQLLGSEQPALFQHREEFLSRVDGHNLPKSRQQWTR